MVDIFHLYLINRHCNSGQHGHVYETSHGPTRGSEGLSTLRIAIYYPILTNPFEEASHRQSPLDTLTHHFEGYPPPQDRFLLFLCSISFGSIYRFHLRFCILGKPLFRVCITAALASSNLLWCWISQRLIRL